MPATYRRDRYTVCLVLCYVSHHGGDSRVVRLESWTRTQVGLESDFWRLRLGLGLEGRGLSRLMHDDLHWLVIHQRVQYKFAVTVHPCLRHRAPRYLADYCVPVSEVPGGATGSRSHGLTDRHNYYRNTMKTGLHFSNSSRKLIGPWTWSQATTEVSEPRRHSVDLMLCKGFESNGYLAGVVVAALVASTELFYAEPG